MSGLTPRRPPGRALLWALLACLGVVAATAAEKADTSAFSKRFDFVVGKEIPVDAVVGRVRFGALKVETEKWSSGGFHLWIRLRAENPEGHDQTVRARVQLASAQGEVLASDEEEAQIEEDESKTLRLSAHMDADPATAIATLLLELDAWDD